MGQASATLVELSHDISSNSHATRQLRLQRQAHHGRMAVSMGRGIAHELRNVAQLVGMLRDVMHQNGETPAPLLEAVTLADNSIKGHINTLEKLPPHPRHTLPVSLAEVVDRAVVMVKRRRRGARMTFVVDVPRELPPVMAVDSDLVELIWELLTNASEAATSRGHGTIHLHASVEPDAVILSVEDDGVGIPEAMRDSLFTAFETSRASEEHLGIGLSTAKSLAEENGGELEADLTVATGARFNLRLQRFHAN